MGWISRRQWSVLAPYMLLISTGSSSFTLDDIFLFKIRIRFSKYVLLCANIWKRVGHVVVAWLEIISVLCCLTHLHFRVDLCDKRRLHVLPIRWIFQHSSWSTKVPLKFFVWPPYWALWIHVDSQSVQCLSLFLDALVPRVWNLNLILDNSDCLNLHECFTEETLPYISHSGYLKSTCLQVRVCCTG